MPYFENARICPNRPRTAIAALTGLLLIPLLCSSLSASADTLTLNGKTASSDVRSINGTPYVKLADVAKALGMIVVKRPGGGYEIIKAGGANQVNGVKQGKVGDLLFDGRWRFQVIGVQTPDSYTMKVASSEPTSYPADTLDYTRASHSVRPKAGYKLVVVQARMINGQKSSQTFWLAPSAERPVNNALADSEGKSYPPVGYDLEGSPIQSPRLLPGAKADFAILFVVPSATEIKDLVFTLTNNDSSGTNDVRVALKP